MTMVTSAEKKAYTDQMLAQHGVKTTGINTKGGEATFVDYGNALNADIKNAILNGGFGENDGWDEAELAMQEDIANLYRNKGKSNFQTSDLIAMLKKAGYKVDSQYISTSYITDNKASGYHTSAKNGAINVLTITDKDGNNIVIADANGNAAIESEELFLNEILSGVVSSFDTSNMNYTEFDNNITVNNNMGISSTLENSSLFEQNLTLYEEEAKKLKEQEKAEKEEEKAKAEAKAKQEKAEAKKAEKEEEKAKAEAEKEYERYKEKRLAELKEEFKGQDISEEELKDLAEDEVEKYMEENYTIA